MKDPVKGWGFLERNAHKVTHVHTGHEMLVDTMYIIVDCIYLFIFKNNIRGFCGDFVLSRCKPAASG